MATTVSSLVQSTRLRLQDWPGFDVLTAAVANTTVATLTVADATKYFINEPIEVDTEAMIVTSNAAGTTLGVRRGAFGSTAATHLNGAEILQKPRFLSVAIIRALADGIDAAWPTVYKRITDTSLTTVASTYEYTVPAMPSDSSQVIPYIWKVELKESGELDYYAVRQWEIIRQATPKVHFYIQQPAGATIRISGYGQFPRLSAGTDTLDADWPRNLEYPLADYAAAMMLASGEYYRVSVDRGVIDEREQANRPGASSAAAQLALGLWLRRVQQSGYPAMVRHAKKVL
jgi:hypothetical protein